MELKGKLVKKTIIALVSSTLAATAAFAVVANTSISSADPIINPTPSAIASSTPAPTTSPSVAPTPTASPSSQYAPGMAPGEHGGWAIVDPNTGRQTGGVIVCTPEVCGSGWFAGMRVVLQTLQDPSEAAHSSNGVGNVAGYSGGSYNFSTGQWTIPSNNRSTLEIPLAYPDANNRPTCVTNCPTIEPTPVPTPTVTPEPSTSPEPSVTSSPAVTSGRFTAVNKPVTHRPAPIKGKSCRTHTTTKIGACTATNVSTGVGRALTKRTSS